MRRLKFLALALAGVVVFASGTYVFADTGGTVSATVRAKFVTVSVTPGTVAYGLLPTSASTSTVAGGQTQTINVGGSNVPVNIAVSSSDGDDPGGGTDWNLENTIGTNQYKHEYSTDSGSSYTVFPAGNGLTDSIDTLIPPGDATQALDFQITAPSSITDGNQKTITITVQASG